jgi:hypothetical protein
MKVKQMFDEGQMDFVWRMLHKCQTDIRQKSNERWMKIGWTLDESQTNVEQKSDEN